MKRVFWSLLLVSIGSGVEADETMYFRGPPGATEAELKKCADALVARCREYAPGDAGPVECVPDSDQLLKVRLTDLWIGKVAEDAPEGEEEAWLKVGWTKENWKQPYARFQVEVLAGMACGKAEIFPVVHLGEEEKKKLGKPDYDDPAGDKAPDGAFWCRTPARLQSRLGKECLLLRKDPMIAAGEIRSIGEIRNDKEWLARLRAKEGASPPASGCRFLELAPEAAKRLKEILAPGAEGRYDSVVWVVDGEAWPFETTLATLRDSVLEGKDGRTALVVLDETCWAMTSVARHPMPFALKRFEKSNGRK